MEPDLELHAARTGAAAGRPPRIRQRERSGRPALGAQSAGPQAGAYRIYASDEKGFSVSDEPYKVTAGVSEPKCASRVPRELPGGDHGHRAGGGRPSARTSGREQGLLPGRRGGREGQPERAFRLRRGPAAGHLQQARDRGQRGVEYRYPVAAIRSLGDLSMRVVNGKETMNYWDVERPRFEIEQGPAWLTIDGATGLLSGKPDRSGTAEVVVAVTLERDLRRLDEEALKWGNEKSHLLRHGDGWACHPGLRHRGRSVAGPGRTVPRHGLTRTKDWSKPPPPVDVQSAPRRIRAATSRASTMEPITRRSFLASSLSAGALAYPFIAQGAGCRRRADHRHPPAHQLPGPDRRPAARPSAHDGGDADHPAPGGLRGHSPFDAIPAVPTASVASAQGGTRRRSNWRANTRTSSCSGRMRSPTCPRREA